jgi:transketolase
MAALMKQRVIFVYTHDSIGLGEDGPTHQPIEHAAMLRLTPQLSVWRPCDAAETAVAWQQALLHKDKPSCLLLSRQNLPMQPCDEKVLSNIARGGYVLLDCAGTPQAIIIATGSEVTLAITAAKQLNEQGKHVRVVSMPSTDLFDAQDAQYKESVLPKNVTARVAVEAGAKDYWYKYVGLNGKIVGIDNRFGESAPASAVFKALGITVENVVQQVMTLIK